MKKQKISYKMRIAGKKEAAACINMSKTSWPNWWSKNKKLGEKHIRDCVEGKRCLVAIVNREAAAFVV